VSAAAPADRSTGPAASDWGCDQSTGLPQQTVILSVGDQYLAHWSVVPGETRAVVLPNGFHLGVKIEAPSRQEYARWAREPDVHYVPEMVEITLFDLTTAAPRELTHTWVGANSLQGYGPNGGADRVDAIGSPGITLLLNKATCVRVDG
jgi:hypothetical protein